MMKPVVPQSLLQLQNYQINLLLWIKCSSASDTAKQTQVRAILGDSTRGL